MFCGWAAKLHSKAERGAFDFSMGPTVRTCSSTGTDPSGANGWRWLEDSARASCSVGCPAPTFWKRKRMHPTESCPSTRENHAADATPELDHSEYHITNSIFILDAWLPCCFNTGGQSEVLTTNY